MANYDILIKGGSVFRQKHLETADIGISGEKISAIGDLSGASANLVIDALGKSVTPGFIDITSHSDTHWKLFNEPAQESLLGQGITTILGGNCGSSLAPLVKGEDIAGIQKWADIREININWRSVSEFFAELSRHPLGVNFATLVGHGTLRRGVIGDDARRANDDEIAQMKMLFKNSLDEGAFGISTSLGSAHGRPANETELAALFETAADEKVITKHHLKDEGKNILPSVVELIQFARSSGAHVHFSHFKFLGRSAWNFITDALRIIDSARAEGLNITVDIFPYTRTGSLLYQLLPPWTLEGGREKIIEELKNEGAREQIKAYLKSLTLHYDRITVASTLHDANALGKNIAELSASSGLHPEEYILRLLETNALKVSIFNEVINPEHLTQLAAKNYATVASDGVGYEFRHDHAFDLPHPRSFGAFPKAFELFVKSSDAVTFEDLVHKITELPAETLGLKNRGKLEKGNFADIAIFDLDKLSSRSDYQNPAVLPEGMEWVLVNGKVALQNGEPTGHMSGKVLKRE